MAIDQDQTTGTEFWAVYTENIGLGPRPFAIGIVNPGTTSANVEVHGLDKSGNEYLANATSVAAGDDAVFLVESLTITRPGVTSQGVFRITSDQPVMAYQMSTAGSAKSNDATWLLPTSSLDKAYRAATYNQGSLPTYIAVVAIQGGTTVEVRTPPAEMVSQSDVMDVLATWDLSPAPPPDQLCCQAGEVWRTASTLRTERLDQFQALYIRSSAGADLTGSWIDADKPVAVFAGAVCTTVGSLGSCDHLAEQVWPSSMWGTTYPVCRSSPETYDAWPAWAEDLYTTWQDLRLLEIPAPTHAAKTDASVYRIVPLTEDLVTVTIQDTSGERTHQLLPYQWLQTRSHGDFVINATHPVAVVEFTGGELDPPHSPDWSWGDPSMLQIAPAGGSDTWQFRVPGGFFVNHLALTATGDAPNVTLDGASVTEWRHIGDGFHCANVQGVGVGVHEVASGAGTSVSLRVMGWDNYGSYGMTVR